MSDGVLYVPEYYEKHEAILGLFEGARGICIEYCSGNGAWVVHKAKMEPHRLWVAVEWRFERVRKIWSKTQNLHLDNLLIVSGEALAFTTHYLPAACVDAVYVNFPDPWPKDKHAKHRLLQPPFAAQLARVLREGGSATFVTDDATYVQQMKEVMQVEACFEGPVCATERPDYGDSYFDQLWREKGRTIHYLDYTKR